MLSDPKGGFSVVWAAEKSFRSAVRGDPINSDIATDITSNNGTERHVEDKIWDAQDPRDVKPPQCFRLREPGNLKHPICTGPPQRMQPPRRGDTPMPLGRERP